MKRSNIKQLFSFCLLFVLSSGLTLAQKETKPQATDQPAPQETKTRARRAAVGPTGEKLEPATTTEPREKSSTTVIEAAISGTPIDATATANKPATTKAVGVTQADPIEALRDEIEAAGTVSEKVRLQFELVDLLLMKGAKPEAVNELRLMANEERFDPTGFYNIANAQARLNDSEAAISTYRKAIDQRKGRYSRALNNLGVMMLRLGRWDEAYESFNSALRIENFRYAEASYNLGRLYVARGENDLAAREWKRAVSVNPEHTAAAQALKRVGGAGVIAVAALPRAGSATAVKQPEAVAEAKPVKAKRASLSPVTLTVDHDSYNYLQRARDARDRGRQEEAVAHYRRVISRMGGYFAPANLEMSYALITLKRSDEAIDSLEAVSQNDGSRYPISYYHLARLYETKNELKRAEESYARAASAYGQDNGQFLLDVSRVREKQGDLQGALAALEEYVAVMERKNLRPQWSDERMASLKQKLASKP